MIKRIFILLIIICSFKTYIYANNDYFEKYFKRGKNALRNKQYNIAITYFKRCCKINIFHQESLDYLAGLYYKTNNFKLAIKTYNYLIKMFYERKFITFGIKNTQINRYHYMLALSYYKNKDYLNSYLALAKRVKNYDFRVFDINIACKSRVLEIKVCSILKKYHLKISFLKNTINLLNYQALGYKNIKKSVYYLKNNKKIIDLIDEYLFFKKYYYAKKCIRIKKYKLAKKLLLNAINKHKIYDNSIFLEIAILYNKLNQEKILKKFLNKFWLAKKNNKINILQVCQLLDLPIEVVLKKDIANLVKLEELNKQADNYSERFMLTFYRYEFSIVNNTYKKLLIVQKKCLKKLSQVKKIVQEKYSFVNLDKHDLINSEDRVASIKRMNYYDKRAKYIEFCLKLLNNYLNQNTRFYKLSQKQSQYNNKLFNKARSLLNNYYNSNKQLSKFTDIRTKILKLAKNKLKIISKKNYKVRVIFQKIIQKYAN